MAYQRPHLGTLKKRVSEPRRFIQVLYGPRQVGKTTAVNQLLESFNEPYHLAAADTVTKVDTVWIEQQWKAARLLSMDTGSSVLLVIDEIQKCANWSEAVKKFWDEDTRNDTPIKVLLLGSSRLLLQQGLTESLAGRFETMYMGHWTYFEMNTAFGFTPDQFVWFGGYPGAARMIVDEARWKRYVRDSLIETSVSKDILMLTRVDKPALMKLLFELGAMHSGQILSYTKMLGQLHDAGNTTTLAHYLELLDTAGLLAGIGKYGPGQLRRRASSPKFQVHNTALMNAQSDRTFAGRETHPDEWGRCVESAVGAHLLNYVRSNGGDLWYWRQGSDEVDFVLKLGDCVAGIEVKSGGSAKAPGMRAFASLYPSALTLIVGSDGLPWQDFLATDPGKLVKL